METAREIEASREAFTAAEQRYAEELESSREAQGQEVRNDDSLAIRSEIASLGSKAEELKRENASLDGRLRKYRSAAAADLERAVPLNTTSCWHSIDAPTLKIVTFLVKSLCMRRTFAIQLLATYAWLFFL